MNFTADLLAEELYKLSYLTNSMVRTYSASREDIFNVLFDELKEFSMLHKMIFDEKALENFQARLN